MAKLLSARQQKRFLDNNWMPQPTRPATLGPGRTQAGAPDAEARNVIPHA